VGVTRSTEGAVLVSELIEAAGGAVIRGRAGDREILIVHRPDHDDWRLPKGKLEDGEDHEHAAIREVQEESGWRCTIGAALPEARYLDANAVAKRVRYWLMRPTERHDWSPSREVDDVRWVSPEAAREALSYAGDLDVLDAALALDEPIFLVRHAKAASRGAWREDDDLRPLTATGLRQAERLRDYLGLETIRSVRSSPAIRCVRTVEPLARELAKELELGEELREGTRLRPALRSLERLAGPSVVCTHGDVVVEVVQSIPPSHRPGASGWKKGSTWILERDGGELIGARYVAPPPDRGD
jgi:8-oxo-dGTP pyrophosphatase MutT (NUDIX family)/phosphohistidine phosphatase SixA